MSTKINVGTAYRSMHGGKGLLLELEEAVDNTSAFLAGGSSRTYHIHGTHAASELILFS